MPAPSHSGRLAGSVAEATDQIAHHGEGAEDDVAGHAANQRGEVRNYDVVGAVWSILLACERLIKPVATTTNDGKSDDQRDHRAEHADRPKPTKYTDNCCRTEDQHVEQLARVPGVKSKLPFQVSDKTKTGIGPGERQHRPRYQ